MTGIPNLSLAQSSSAESGGMFQTGAVISKGGSGVYLAAVGGVVAVLLVLIAYLFGRK